MTAVRPPEYFPRLPYAALLLAADRVVLADTFPFSRQSGHNRARVRTAGGAAWITVPRQHGGLAQPLTQVAPVDDGWRRRHLATLRAAYGMAPYYDHVAPELADLLGAPHASLGALAAETVAWAARWLGSAATLVRASALPGAPDTLAALDAGGALLTLPESADRDRQRWAGPVHVLRYAEGPRRQVFPGFEPDLSVLDLVFNYGPAAGDVLREGLSVGPA